MKIRFLKIISTSKQLTIKNISLKNGVDNFAVFSGTIKNIKLFWVVFALKIPKLLLKKKKKRPFNLVLFIEKSN